MSDVYDELFEKREEQKKEKKEAEDKKASRTSYEYEDVKYMGLNPDSHWGFRPLGLPFEIRKNSTDSKIVLRSDVLKDGGTTYIKVNWRYIEVDGGYKPDPDWILTKLHDAILEAKFVKYVESDIDGVNVKKDDEGLIKNKKGYEGRYIDLYSNKESYFRVKDNKAKNWKYPARFYPQTRVAIPIISRMDNWCKENKHAMVLTTKLNSKDYPQEDGTVKVVSYTDCGVSYAFYDKLIEYYKKFRRDWNTDFVVKRYKSGDNWTEDIYDFSLRDRIPEDVAKLISDIPLTEEEKSYELYDLDKLFKVSSYQKLLRHCKGLFQQVDADLGTDFLTELQNLVKVEKEKYDKIAEEAKKNETAQVETSSEEPVKEEIVQTETVPESKTEEPVKEERTARSSGEDNISLLKSHFKFWDKIEEADKKDIINQMDKIENGVLLYKPEFKLLPCNDKSCNTLLPETVRNCPTCGINFG